MNCHTNLWFEVLVRDIPTCRELVARVVAEAQTILAHRLPGLVCGG